MPIFSIKCSECNAIDEVLMRSASAETPHCRQCGSPETERMVSRPSVCTGGRSGGSCPTGTCPFVNA